MITLRPVVAEDREFLEGVYAATRTEEMALTGWSEEQQAAFCKSQSIAQEAHYRAHYPTAEFCVIERDGLPVGRLYVDRWPREIRIMDIALVPEHRGAGIGTEFVRALQEESAAAGKSLSIHVEKFNPALQWYEHLGFCTREDKGVYVLMEWRNEVEG